MAMRWFVAVGLIVMIACVTHVTAAGIRITRIRFDTNSVPDPVVSMRVQMLRGPRDFATPYFACSSERCQMVPTGTATVELTWGTAKLKGDVLRVMDPTMRGLDWVAWGSPPPHSESTDIFQAHVRTYKCANVLDPAMRPQQSRGLAPTGIDGAWEWMAEPTMATCLAAVPDGDTSSSASSSGTGTEIQATSAMHLTFSSTHGLTFARWISGALACELPYRDRSDRDDRRRQMVWLDPQIASASATSTEAFSLLSDAFWTYERNLDNSSCSVAKFRTQVESVVACLGFEMLINQVNIVDDEAPDAWALPFADQTNPPSVLPVRLSSWQKKWNSTFATTPLFFCRRESPTSDVTHLHSILVRFDHPTADGAAQFRVHTQPNGDEDVASSQLWLDELALDTTSIVLCPAYFHQ